MAFKCSLSTLASFCHKKMKTKHLFCLSYSAISLECYPLIKYLAKSGFKITILIEWQMINDNNGLNIKFEM